MMPMLFIITPPCYSFDRRSRLRFSGFRPPTMASSSRATRKLEGVEGRVYVEQVITKIDVEPLVPAPPQLGSQPVKRRAHREVFHEPIFKAGIELKHRSCVIIDGQIEKVIAALKLQLRRDIEVRDEADRRERKRQLLVHTRCAKCSGGR